MTSRNKNTSWQQQVGQQQQQQQQCDHLRKQGFSSGLILAHRNETLHNCPMRLWLLDNSVFMKVKDAHISRGNYGNGNCQNVDDVTRWEELCDCVLYHSQIAQLFTIPMRFALLHKPTTMGLPQYFGLNHQGGSNGNGKNIQQEMQIVTNVLSNSRICDGSPTVPLTKQLKILREYIVSITAQLLLHKQTASIIIATQGCVDEEFIQTLRSFENLPVSFVVRLCTDDERTFEAYNSLDPMHDHKQWNLSFDVLDDHAGEALEVYLHNPWLTYGLPLHRFREMAFRIDVLNVLDERALTKKELGSFCYLLFATTNPLPDPERDWDGFLRGVQQLLSKEQSQWNPVTKTVTAWVNLTILNSLYGHTAEPPPSYNSYAQNQHRQQQQQQQPQYQFHQNQTSQQAQNNHNQFQFQQNQVPPLPQQQQQQQQQQVSPPPSQKMNINGPIQDLTELKKTISMTWILQPPNFTSPRTLPDLLGSIGSTFLLVNAHKYFQEKYHPFSSEALTSGDSKVMKRAVRKMKFFLHPDKLPKDLTEQQSLLCKILWDVISEAAENYTSAAV